MRTKLKHWLGNLSLALAALLTVLAVLEFAVFRTILKPDDVIANVTINDVVRYEPGRIASFRHPDGRESTVQINSDGWNSVKPRYERTRSPDRLRIAVIGDSYVHASAVNVEQAFPELIEQRLKETGIDAEVLRFGMDGAPLSQYLHVLRREVTAYSPDLVLVQLIHNDFDESYRFLKTRYASSFLKVDVDEQGHVTEFAPIGFVPSIADLLRASAMFRYLYYETNLYLTLKSWVSRYFWGGDESYSPEHIVSGIDVRKLDDPARITRVTRYILAEMQKLAVSHEFKLAVAMDGVRETVYRRPDAQTAKVAQLNAIAAEATARVGVPFLDLTETFGSDFAQHKLPFEYPYDWHWNVRANALVGTTLADWLLADPRLLGSTNPAARAAEARAGNAG